MQEETPLKRFFSSFGLLQKIVVLVLVLMAAGGIGLLVHHSQTAPDPNAPKAGYYVSKADGFTIKFRSKPKIDHASVPNSTGGSIPQTTYETASADGKAAFAVSVAQYPKSYTFTKASLQQIAKSQAQNSTDGKLLSESYVHYLGKDTLESSYNTVSGGTTYTVYGISLANGNKLYNIYSIGASKADFSAFVKTFAFVN